MIGVASRSPVSAERAMHRHGFAYSTCEPKRLLEDPEVDLVVIATPHHLHASQAIDALQSGKIVFVEKPMATCREDLRQLAAVMAERGPWLQVGFNRRYAPAVDAVRGAFADVRESKTLVYRIAAGAPPDTGWMSDPSQGGRVIGEVCHFVDTAQSLIGSWPRSVHADRLGGTILDGVAITLCYNDGSVATIIYATGNNPKTPKESIEMFGGGVSASIDDFCRWVVHKGARRLVKKGAQDKGHRAEINALLTRLHSEDAVAGDPLAAICATDVTFAILESLQTGRTVKVSPWL
jgi:polar amino acid transport system substrate-binding protein